MCIRDRHISSCYAKILEEQIFSLGSFPEVGQKQKTEKKERAKVDNNNGQLRIANATSGGARKAAWANLCLHIPSKWVNIGWQ